MPETTNLRAYLARLEELLRTNATDEVVQHCRHILQYFPKHVDTYRLLGRALLYNARWDEASTVLLRVLAVYPDDFVAHLGLAEIYGERNKGNDAIWHLERAFEHEPNNEELIASLRDLYKRFRGTEYGKIQLTAGAIARQYGRNGLYEQAIDTLRHTLEDHGDRVDLRLLLAQMMWGAGQQVEAAEVALDVLSVLPDCLEANRILTRLWLNEDRPSDAQRYINRIEALDPYAALEVATGAQAPDDAFTLPELDFRRYADSVLTTNQPEWLRDIGDNSSSFAPPETINLPRRSTPTIEPEPLPDDLGVLSEEWLTETDLSRLKPTPSPASTEEAASDIDRRFDDRLDDVEPPEPTTSVAARDLRRETSTHASIFADHETNAEVPDWLASADNEPAQPLPELVTSADPLAWLRDSGVELDDEDVAGVPLGQAAAPPEPEADDDPMAWLRDSGIEVTDADLAALTHENPVVPTAEGEKDDPLAWLRDSGIEIDEAAPAPLFEDPFETADEMPLHDPASDPLGWMSSYGEEIVWNEDAPPVAPVAASEDDEDNFEWLQDEALLDDNDASAAPPGQPAPEADHNEDNIVTGMLRRLDAKALPQEMTILENNDAASPAPADELNWLTDAGGSAQTPAPQEAQAADRREAMADKDSNLNPDWRDDEQAAGGDSAPDWLNDIAGAEDAPDESPATPNEEVPEWLAALGPTYAQPESLTAEQRAQEIPSEADEDAAFSWTAQLDDEEEVTPPAQANQAEDFPAWLHAEELAVSSAKENPNPDWLSDFQSDDETDAEHVTALESDVPEWLSALQPPESSGAPVLPRLDDDEVEAQESDLEFGWIDQMIEQEENEAAPAVSQPEASAPIESEISWLPDFGEDEEAAPTEQESPVGLEMPDWLNNLAETEKTGANAPEEQDEVINVETFEWASELDEAETPAAETPVSAVDTPSAPEAEGFSWESEFQAPAVSAVDDTPEWLRDFEAASELPEQPEADATVVTVQPGEQPEWLSETLSAQDSAANEPEAAPADTINEFEFGLSDDQTELAAIAETEHRPAQNAPDWLNAMVPGVDLDYTPEAGESSEPEPVARVDERRGERDFEWLADIVEEETQPAAEPVAASAPETPRFSFSKPPAWLRGQQANVGHKHDIADWPSDNSE